MIIRITSRSGPREDGIGLARFKDDADQLVKVQREREKDNCGNMNRGREPRAYQDDGHGEDGVSMTAKRMVADETLRRGMIVALKWVSIISKGGGGSHNS